MRSSPRVPIAGFLLLVGCGHQTATLDGRTPAGGSTTVTIDGRSLAVRVRNDGPDRIRVGFGASGSQFVHFEIEAGGSTDAVMLDASRRPPMTVVVSTQGSAGAGFVVEATGEAVSLRSGEVPP